MVIADHNVRRRINRLEVGKLVASEKHQSVTVGRLLSRAEPHVGQNVTFTDTKGGRNRTVPISEGLEIELRFNGEG